MFCYYLGLAWRSMMRTPVVAVLSVLAIGLGIGACMTMVTVIHAMAEDPLPKRSAHLYRPYLNPLPISYDLRPGKLGSGPNAALTWPDAMALLRAHKGVHQAAMAQGYLVARPSSRDVLPKVVQGCYTTHDFFTMFGVPFIHGDVWSERDGAEGAPVVVLTQTLARRLFGTDQAVGKFAHLGKHDFRVIGVVKDWHPVPAFYTIGTHFDVSDQFFIPLSTALALNEGVTWTNGWGSGTSSLTNTTVSWLQMWVQLDTPKQVAAYRQFLEHYSAEEKALGRYERPASDAKLYGMMQWLDIEGLLPSDVLLQTWLALGFLCVCMINIVALLLAKFLRRSTEISVRRALGARRRDIFHQFGLESAVIGLAGGLLGIGVAEFGLWTVRQRPTGYAHLAQMDGVMLIVTVILAIALSILAGLLPSWRACRIAPAIQLKTF